MKLSQLEINDFNQYLELEAIAAQGVLFDDNNFTSTVRFLQLQTHCIATQLVKTQLNCSAIDLANQDHQHHLSLALYALRDRSQWQALSPEDQVSVLKFRFQSNVEANESEALEKSAIQGLSKGTDFFRFFIKNPIMGVVNQFATKPLLDYWGEKNFPDHIELADVQALSNEVFKSDKALSDILDLPLTLEAQQFVSKNVFARLLTKDSAAQQDSMGAPTVARSISLVEDAEAKEIPSTSEGMSKEVAEKRVNLAVHVNIELEKKLERIDESFSISKKSEESFVKKQLPNLAKAAYFIGEVLYRVQQVKGDKERFEQFKQEAVKILEKNKIFNIEIDLLTHKELPTSLLEIREFVIRQYDQCIFQTTQQSHHELKCLREQLAKVQQRLDSGYALEDKLKQEIVSIQKNQKRIAGKINRVHHDTFSPTIAAIGQASSSLLFAAEFPVAGLVLGTIALGVSAYSASKEKKKQKKVRRYQGWLEKYNGAMQGMAAVLSGNSEQMGHYGQIASALESALADPDLYSPEAYRKKLAEDTKKYEKKINDALADKDKIDKINEKLQEKHRKLEEKLKEKMRDRKREVLEAEKKQLEGVIETNKFISKTIGSGIEDLKDKNRENSKLLEDKDKTAKLDDWLYRGLLELENPDFIGMTDEQIDEARKKRAEQDLPLKHFLKLLQAKEEDAVKYIHAYSVLRTGLEIPVHYLSRFRYLRRLPSVYTNTVALMDIAIQGKKIWDNVSVLRSLIATAPTILADANQLGAALIGLNNFVGPGLAVLSLGIKYFHPTLIPNPVLLQLAETKELVLDVGQQLALKMQEMSGRVESLGVHFQQTHHDAMELKKSAAELEEKILQLISMQKTADERERVESAKGKFSAHKKRVIKTVQSTELDQLNEEFLERMLVRADQAYDRTFSEATTYPPAMLAAMDPVNFIEHLLHQASQSPARRKRLFPDIDIFDSINRHSYLWLAKNKSQKLSARSIDILKTFRDRWQAIHKELLRHSIDTRWLLRLVNEYKKSCSNIISFINGKDNNMLADDIYSQQYKQQEALKAKMLGTAFVGASKFYLTDLFAHDAPLYIVKLGNVSINIHSQDEEGNAQVSSPSSPAWSSFRDQHFGSLFMGADYCSLWDLVRNPKLKGWLSVKRGDGVELRMDTAKIKSPFPKAYEAFAKDSRSYFLSGYWQRTAPAQQLHLSALNVVPRMSFVVSDEILAAYNTCYERGPERRQIPGFSMRAKSITANLDLYEASN